MLTLHSKTYVGAPTGSSFTPTGIPDSAHGKVNFIITEQQLKLLGQHFNMCSYIREFKYKD